ncbi:MAG: L-2-hydroxyglutarate oxidase [Gammaproteobacteria bacterium]|nr:L-2-hydroxyglutarate oxidase [Gammaproteobacteria bacterium]
MTNNPTPCDFLIIGAGIIGTQLALTLKRRHPDAHIILIEKEAYPGLHASGRNSGVLHAGFYYSKDSLKAKFSKLGNQALTRFCLERNLPINQCGKLVVARHQQDLTGLQELYRRGQENDIELQLITEQDAKEIEPYAKTYQQALFSPTTSSVDPKIIMTELLHDLQTENIALHCQELFLKREKHLIRTNRACYAPGYVINTAGLYADKIAKQFGFASHYEILPFKGLYLYKKKTQEKLRVHIYPVPDLNYPFLGVHFTLNTQGDVKIGPTAIPAFWREHYEGMHNFKLSETMEIVTRQLGLLMGANFNFRQLALSELKKYNRQTLVTHAAELAHGVQLNDFIQWGKPGIRAQLIDTRHKKLEMDFVVEHDEHSLHVLNAVSPAFTCSLPFAEHLADLILV